jgi:tRNA A-37 threonylcarbamoyl transferase component Bud32
LAKKILARTKRINIKNTVVDLLQILFQMHEMGVVHGDVHGGNFMQDNSGKWYIIDFGLASHSYTKQKRFSDLKELWNTVYGLTLDYSTQEWIFTPSLKIIANAMIPYLDMRKFVKEQKFFE